jgi:hypothetical protein
MLKVYVILIAFLSLMFSSCENSTDVGVAPPYQEYVVINSQLSAFKDYEGVKITHTLPLGTEYDITKAEIKDAVVYILEDGIRVIPLHYTSEGNYKPLMNINIQVRSTYELFASVDNRLIYSKTIVPDVPHVVSASDVENTYLSAEVEAKPGEAYGAAWIISAGTNNNLKAENFFSVESPDHYPSNVLVRTQDIPPPYNTPGYSSNVYIQVFAFDKAYKDYFITKTNSDPVTNTFTSGGGSVAWNVQGENVIGLFIGVAEGSAVSP